MNPRNAPRLVAAGHRGRGFALAAALAGAALFGACGRSDTPPAGQQATTPAAAPTASEARAVAGHGLGDDLGEGLADPSAAASGSAELHEGGASELDRDTYVVRVKSPPSASQGEGGVAEIHVVPKEGWKMNHDFPMLLTVQAPEGVAIEGAEQEIADAVHYSDERGEWAVRFTPEAGGEKSFEADFRFAVCTEEVCIPKREKLAWVVEVE